MSTSQNSQSQDKINQKYPEELEFSVEISAVHNSAYLENARSKHLWENPVSSDNKFLIIWGLCLCVIVIVSIISSNLFLITVSFFLIILFVFLALRQFYKISKNLQQIKRNKFSLTSELSESKLINFYENYFTVKNSNIDSKLSYKIYRLLEDEKRLFLEINLSEVLVIPKKLLNLKQIEFIKSKVNVSKA